MKKLLVITLLSFGMVCAYAQTAPKANGKSSAAPAPAPAPAGGTKQAPAADPGYKFDVLSHDYGTIKKGADPYCEFKLTNTSKAPLVITEAHGSCGCTVPEYPKEPIKPGETVIIKVRYDTNRPGAFSKTVTVTFAGIATPAVLSIHGTVEVPPAETAFPSPGTGNGDGGVPVNN